MSLPLVLYFQLYILPGMHSARVCHCIATAHIFFHLNQCPTYCSCSIHIEILLVEGYKDIASKIFGYCNVEFLGTYGNPQQVQLGVG